MVAGKNIGKNFFFGPKAKLLGTTIFWQQAKTLGKIFFHPSDTTDCNNPIHQEYFFLLSEILKSKTLTEGDIIIFFDGGHGIKFIEKSEIIEIKQGPYSDTNDKKNI